MNVPDQLADFPAVPEGLKGWPWERSDTMGQGFKNALENWPRITIVTPSYNQGRFLEATIRSVLLQGYPNLEYIVIDGGSSDDSVEIIKKYDRWIDFWVSEPDQGQSHAINKGFDRATGHVLAWLNSDDMHAPETLWRIGEVFSRQNNDVASGHSVFMDENGNPERRYEASPVCPHRLLSVRGGFSAPQQSTFWSRQCWERNGPLSEDLHYVMDYDYWIRMAAAGEKWVMLDRDLAYFRHHGAQKTADLSSNAQMLRERRRVLERFIASDRCTKSLYRTAVCGLRENRVKEIRVAYASVRSKTPFWMYWAKAALQHPGCLMVPAFYGLALRGAGIQYGCNAKKSD